MAITGRLNINYIAGSGITIVGADNPTLNAADITISVTPGSAAAWYTGAGAPTTLHNDGDFYLRQSNGEVYKQVAGAWVDQGFSILGPTGATGATGGAGTNGATWYTGAGAPSTLHTNGDLYLNQNDGEVWKQVAGAWVDQGFTIKGSDGGGPTATHAWMPLTTTVGGVPQLVFDGSDALVPTYVPI